MDNSIVWNLDRAVEHLCAAYKLSQTDDPNRHADLREVLESVNLTLSAVRQALDAEEESEE